MCCPTGFAFPGYCGQNSRARFSFTIATGTDVALSCAVNFRPRFSVIANVRKYSGEMFCVTAIGRSFSLRGGIPANCTGCPTQVSVIGRLSVTAALRTPGTDSACSTRSL